MWGESRGQGLKGPAPGRRRGEPPRFVSSIRRYVRRDTRRVSSVSSDATSDVTKPLSNLGGFKAKQLFNKFKLSTLPLAIIKVKTLTRLLSMEGVRVRAGRPKAGPSIVNQVSWESNRRIQRNPTFGTQSVLTLSHDNDANAELSPQVQNSRVPATDIAHTNNGSHGSVNQICVRVRHGGHGIRGIEVEGHR